MTWLFSDLDIKDIHRLSVVVIDTGTHYTVFTYRQSALSVDLVQMIHLDLLAFTITKFHEKFLNKTKSSSDFHRRLDREE